MNYARTISYEVRQQQKDLEELQRKAWLQQDTKAQAALKTSYETYAKPVQESFDSIVAGSMRLLQNITLEQRVDIIKQQFRKRVKDKVARTRTGGQFSALKSMGVDDKRALNLG